jgi:hypothetical protein
VFLWKVFSLFALNTRKYKPFTYLNGLFKDKDTKSLRAKHRNYISLSNTDYVYDGFVVYCDEDRDWVHEKLVPVLDHDN